MSEGVVGSSVVSGGGSLSFLFFGIAAKSGAVAISIILLIYWNFGKQQGVEGLFSI